MKNPLISLLLFPWLAAVAIATQVPVANNDSVVAVENTRLAITFDLLLANDEFSNGPATGTFISPFSLPAAGDLDTNADDINGFFYDPDLGFFGPDVFTYTLTSQATASAPAPVYLWTAPWRLALAGNWDGDRDDISELAWFSNITGRLFLCDGNGYGDKEGLACTMFTTTDLDTIGKDPLAMDWDGDGVDEIAFFDPANGSFTLTDYDTTTNNLKLIGDVVIPAATGQRPIVGDWNNNDVDTVGYYNSETGQFHLHNSNTPGPPDHVFTLLIGNSGGLPIAGDWNHNGQDGVGVYDRITGEFHLSNTTNGFVDEIFVTTFQDVTPFSGRWRANSPNFVATYNRETHIAEVYGDRFEAPRVVQIPEDPCG